MKFSEFVLNENSLYTNSTEKEEFLKNKEAVMNALIFNFFGFLGLFKLSDSSEYLKTYKRTEGSVMPTRIGDDNHDLSLSVKLAYDLKMINQDTFNNMTKLLALIKRNKLTGDQLDENIIRGFLDKIRYKTYKPSQRVFTLIKQFHEGAITLPELSKALYKLSRLNDFESVSREYKKLVEKGHYIDLFLNLKDVLPDDNIDNVNVTNNTDKIGQQDSVTTKNNDTFYEEVFRANSLRELNKVLKQYGIDKTQINAEEFKNWFNRNKQHLGLDISITKPIYSIIAADAKDAKKEGAIFASQLLDEYLVSKAKEKNIKQFLNDFEQIKLEEITKIRKLQKSFLPTEEIKEYIITLINEFIFQIVAQLPPTEDSVKYVTEKFTIFKNSCIDTYSVFPHTIKNEINPALFENGFNKTTAILLASGILTKYFIIGSNSPINLETWLAKAFGENCLISTEQKDLYLKKSAFESASDENKQAFMLLVSKNFMNAKIFDDSNFLNDILKTLFDELNGVDGYFAYQKILKSFSEKYDFKNFTDSDIRNAADLINQEKNVKLLCISLDYIADYTTSTLSVGERNLVKFLLLALLEYANKFDDENNSYIVAISSFFDDKDVSTKLKRFAESSNGLKDINIDQATKFQKVFISNVLKNGGKNDILESISKLIIKTLKRNNSISAGDDAVKLFLFYIYSNDNININEYVFYNTEVSLRILKDTSLWDTKNGKNYILWLVKNFKEVKDELVKYFENFLMSEIDFVSNFDESRFEYPTYVIMDDFVTEAMINKFIQIWTHRNYSSKQGKEAYSSSKKLTKAFDEVFSFEYLKNTNKKDGFILKVIENSPIDKVNEFFKDTTNSEFINFLTRSNSDDYETINLKGFSEFMSKIANNSEFINKASSEVLKRLKFAVEIVTDVVGNNKIDKSRKKEIIDNYCEILYGMVDNGRTDEVSEIFDEIKGKFRTKIIDYFYSVGFIKSVYKEIFKDDAPIKPKEKLNHERIVEILRYNRIELPKIGRVKNFNDLLEKAENVKSVIRELNVEQVEKTEEEMERRSIEYDVFNKYRHGQIAVKFIREFNVRIPEQEIGHKEFLKEHPNTEIIDPAFHGTGSIAASMILRYGFAVIKSSDPSVVGRMLGDGIYFTNTLDKAAQYASDNGYTRKRGERGYIFQMEALLGEEDKNYKAAGLGGDGIVSPEWCVFDPNRQLKIYKAFEVEIIDKKEMDELKQKHNINENTAVKLISFKEFIKESEDGMNVTTYVFMDGLIPISNNDVVDFEEFNPAQFGDHVWVETSQSGPMICIKHNGQESEAFCVRNTSAFMRDTKELDKFLSLLRKR